MHADDPVSSRTPRQPPQPPLGGLVAAPDDDTCLDAVQLDRLEQSFRQWAAAAGRVLSGAWSSMLRVLR